MTHIKITLMPILQAGVMRKLLAPSESIATFFILQSVLVPELLLLDNRLWTG